ncbi:MAG: sulfatase [Deltaproteobacteria bacterium]|nr:MAG: sulfatase [Deltaproteobacteria bacterium]
MNNILQASFVLALASFIAPVSMAKDIIHDAEYRMIEPQYSELWAAEDEQIDARLAELREKNGGKPPNIVYILLDDLGFGEIGTPDLDVIRGYSTPNISDFASEGVSLMRMYTEPSCTPTRVAMMTGRTPFRTGFDEAKAVPEGEGLPGWEVTLAEVLSKAGYVTTHIGKWHLGDIEESYAINQGFDYAEHPIHQQGQMAVMNKTGRLEGLSAGTDMTLRSDQFEVDESFRIDPSAMVYGIVGKKGGKSREVNMQPGDIFDADDYRRMEENYFDSMMNQLDVLATQDKPFFLQYWPMYPLTLTRSDIKQGRTLNGGPMAEALVTVDEWIGEIMDKIDALGIADNTIVVVMGDNGPFMEFVDKSGQSDRIYRGGKGQHLEGGVRVNAYARWPGVFEAGTRAQDIFHIADLYTTFARLANADKYIPRDRLIDGIDQAPTLLLGEGNGRRDYVFIYEGPVLKSVVKQQFKFHVPPPGANPILEGGTYDLYKNPREDRPQDSIALAVGFGANFGMMIKRHEAMKIKYPNRKPAHGDPYGGIENLRPETKELLENLKRSQRIISGDI